LMDRLSVLSVCDSMGFASCASCICQLRSRCCASSRLDLRVSLAMSSPLGRGTGEETSLASASRFVPISLSS
jgi:hypothetical protein